MEDARVRLRRARDRSVGIRTQQRGHHPARGIGISEIMKMIDSAASVDPIADDAGPLGAAEHRRRIDDQVVVFPVVQIGDKRLERAPGGAPRQIAAHDVQVRGCRLPWPIEHAYER